MIFAGWRRAWLIGQAFGTYLQQVAGKRTVSVGWINRHTFEALTTSVRGIVWASNTEPVLSLRFEGRRSPTR